MISEIRFLGDFWNIWDLEHCVYLVEDHSITLGHHMRNCRWSGPLIYGWKNNEEPEGTYFGGLSILCSRQICTGRDMVQILSTHKLSSQCGFHNPTSNTKDIVPISPWLLTRNKKPWLWLQSWSWENHQCKLMWTGLIFTLNVILVALWQYESFIKCTWCTFLASLLSYYQTLGVDLNYLEHNVF